MNSDLLYRQLIALVCFVPFLAQTFSKTFIVADYYAHKNKYAQNCENKAKPIVRCYGRCQLAKKLQQEEQKKQEHPDRKELNKSEVTTFTGFGYSATALNPQTANAKKNIPLSAGNSIDLSFDIFHPPQV